LEISIALTLSNPKLGIHGVTYRIYELINKAAGKTPGGGENPNLGNPDFINMINELNNKATGDNSRPQRERIDRRNNLM